MRKELDSGKARVDWVIPVGSGYADSKRLNLSRVQQLSRKGIFVEVSADKPHEARVLRVVVKDMPAPKPKR